MVQSRMQEEYSALHRDAIVVDMHGHPPVDLEHIGDLKQGGVTAMVLSLVTDMDLWSSYILKPDNPMLIPYMYDGWAKAGLMEIDDMYLRLSEHRDEISIALKTEDIRKAKKEGKVSFILAFEGGKPLEGSLGLLRTFYKLGVRHLQLTWNYRNQISDGVVEPSKGGLTNFGRDVISEMNKLGMVIDLTHISQKGFSDVLAITKDPLVVSHSQPRALQPGPEQQLSDEQLKALAENGGVLGLHFKREHLKNYPKSTLDDWLDSMDYVIKLIGVDHVGLGPDLVYPASEYFLRFAKMMEKLRPANYPPGWDHRILDCVVAIREMPQITKGILSRGYSDKDTKKILGENYLRIFEQVVG